MANTRAGDSTLTFSRLIPASRCPSFQHTLQLQNRVLPDPCLKPASNQSSGTSSEQPRPAIHDDEIQAVSATYSVRSGDHDLPPSAQKMYRLVARMAAQAMSGSNEHPGSLMDSVDAVRCIHEFIRETTLDLDSARRDLSRSNEDTRLYRFHAHLGDYAGFVCALLKEGVDTHLLTQPWTTFVRAMDKEQAAQATWKASGQSTTYPDSPFLGALEARVQDLIHWGYTDLDFDTALFAVRAYARRNYLAHGASFDLSKSRKFAELADYLDADDKCLEDLLPMEEKPQVDKYRKLLTFYRTHSIRQNSKGEWVMQAPLSTKRSPLRPSSAAFRARVEMGEFRSPGSSGPPPPNVSFSPSAFRSRSELIVGSKRPAEEQPPGQPPAKKAARGLDYVKLDKEGKRPPKDMRLEAAKAKIDDNDAWGVQQLQCRLHDLAALLADHDPTTSNVVFKQQIQQLELELVSARQGMEKCARRKQNKPSAEERKQLKKDNAFLNKSNINVGTGSMFD